MRTFTLMGILLGMLGLCSPTRAEVLIVVNKTSQRMSVSVDGQERYSWPVSTGMAGYSTPRGAFTPSRMAKVHYSREWDDAPMPHSIFFTDAGHAIHGSNAVSYLGTPASHGCVRLSFSHARLLFELVRAEGVANTRIEVAGADPIGIGLGDVSASGHGYGGIVGFDPLVTGIIAGEPQRRQRR